MQDSDDDQDWYEEGEQDINLNISEVKEHSFILVKYVAKKVAKHFVGQIEKIEGINFYVSFMKRKGSGNTFIFPGRVDLDIVSKADVIAHLPDPQKSGSTARAQEHYVFCVDLSTYNVE